MRRYVAIAIALTVSFAFVGPTRARTSWFDEALYASRAVNWMESGRTDSAYLDAPQADARVFVVYPMVLGEVFRTFGASLLTNRLFGLACHAIACLSVYGALAGLRVDPTARLLAVGALATDASFTWFVRSGRPDTLVLALLSLCLLGVVGCAVSTRFPAAALGGGLSGVTASLALLAHPYSIPWLAALAVGFGSWLIGASGAGRATLRLAGLLGALVGVLAVGAPYVVWLGEDPAASRSALLGVGHALAGPREAFSSPSLELELRRWMRGTLVHPLRWTIVSMALLTVKRLRGVYLGCLLAMGGYFVLLWRRVPQETWYQVGYVVLPLTLALGLALDAWRRGGRRAWPAVRAMPLLASGAILEGLLCASLFPAAALLQWKERSYARLKEEVRETLPEDARVATTFAAYLALVECGMRPVFLDDRHRLETDDASRRRYHERILERDFQFVVLPHGRQPATLAPALAEALSFTRTVGSAKEPLLFARDGPYHFDIYAIRAGRDGAGAGGASSPGVRRGRRLGE